MMADGDEGSSVGLIDSHAHLTDPALCDRVDEVLARCDEAGVDHIISVGTTLRDSRNALALAGRYPSRIHAAAGFHPHEAERVEEEDFDALRELWTDPGVVGLGEMGLDYHYDFADRTAQRAVFTRQLDMAAPHGKPVIIHCREAFDDVIRLLRDHGFEGRPVVFHCFTGTEEEAARLARYGWRLSFTGIVTYPKSTWLHEIASEYPAEELMVETDSPYLSPVPVRGQQPNEPARVVHIARFLAALRGVAFEDLVEQTRHHTQSFFGL